MKKLFLILIIFPFACFAQEKAQVTEKSNLSVGFSFAPEYANRTAKAEDALGEFILSFSDGEKAKFGFTTGINIDYQITNWLSFETGMLFSNKGYKEKVWLRENESDAGKEYCSRYNIYYLEIPLKFKYYFAELQKINFYAVGGLVPAVYLSNKLKSDAAEVNNTSIYQDGSTKFNKLNLSGALGLGCKYQFNPDWFLDVEAGYRHSFFPMDDLALKRKLYSLGVDFTLYYRL